MNLATITINNFKNIAEASLEFSPKVNCLLGNNGMGKSNLLDAIHYLSFCKSFTGAPDRMLLRRGEEWLTVSARYVRRGVDEELQLGMAPGRRKQLRRGGKPYRKLSEHIGAFPLVMSSPHDVDLIRDTSEERRRLIDMIIAQADARYLDAMIRYGQCLDQRNRMLRDGMTDPALYMALEMQMDRAADYLTRARAGFIDRLGDIFARYYSAIAGEGEHVELAYVSAMLSASAPLTDLLQQARVRDEALGHTTVGPHRDDIEMTIDGMPMRRAGSQGQCKTYVIALRLAQYEFLRDATQMKPMLLLDDIFDKLDARRVERIMEIVTRDDFGQIFITDTNRTHLDEIMARTQGDYRMWLVDSGTFTPLH